MGRMILLDTNIFIDHLNKCERATAEIDAYENPAMSRMTYMELRCKETPEEKPLLDELFETISIIEMEPAVIEEAIALRKTMLAAKSKAPWPDIIIAATCKVYNGVLITRNIKDFQQNYITAHKPYEWELTTNPVTGAKSGMLINDYGPYVLDEADESGPSITVGSTISITRRKVALPRVESGLGFQQKYVAGLPQYAVIQMKLGKRIKLGERTKLVVRRFVRRKKDEKNDD